jgi:hypothetical protein
MLFLILLNIFFPYTGGGLVCVDCTWSVRYRFRVLQEAVLALGDREEQMNKVTGFIASIGLDGIWRVKRRSGYASTQRWR